MKEERFNFWQKWLTWANVMVLVIGLMLAVAPSSIFLKMHNDCTADVFFNQTTIPADAEQMRTFLFGIIGGTIFGFQVLMIFISENAFKKKERWAYFAMLFGYLSWFLIDSSLSIMHGALYNVLLINIPAMILIGLPLIFTARYFR